MDPNEANSGAYTQFREFSLSSPSPMPSPSYNNRPLLEPALGISPQPPTASTPLPSRELSTE
ncbi:hypothetical protein N7461_003427 [Penicillium sp. DV-2018c]|nr:hypothetical protein N7461_003427 [Penicillium sp. DV-2018c]